MTRLCAGVAIVGLGLLSLGCASGASESPRRDDGSSAARTVTYKCAGCGKTVTVAEGAPAPSC